MAGSLSGQLLDRRPLAFEGALVEQAEGRLLFALYHGPRYLVSLVLQSPGWMFMSRGFWRQRHRREAARLYAPQGTQSVSARCRKGGSDATIVVRSRSPVSQPSNGNSFFLRSRERVDVCSVLRDVGEVAQIALDELGLVLRPDRVFEGPYSRLWRKDSDIVGRRGRKKPILSLVAARPCSFTPSVTSGARRLHT